MFRGKGQTQRKGEWKLLFTADFHGSDVCFRKFLNAAKFYGADALLIGGDLTGKVMVPVIKRDAGYAIKERDRETSYSREDELEEAERRLRDRGAYPFRTTQEELLQLREDEEAVDRLRESLIRDQLQRWRSWAEERLNGIPLLLVPGNDDPWAVDHMLRDWGGWNIDGRSVELRGLTVIGVGVSNWTPWNSPREFEEQQIADLIDKAVDGSEGTLIFNIHVPPHDTKLDVCPRVGEDLRPVMRGGDYELIHAGSTAVREAIRRHRPILSLHGHIHESPGVDQIDSTVVINPGSEYGAGVLRGALVTMRDTSLERYQIVSG